MSAFMYSNYVLGSLIKNCWQKY